MKKIKIVLCKWAGMFLDHPEQCAVEPGLQFVITLFSVAGIFIFSCVLVFDWVLKILQNM